MPLSVEIVTPEQRVLTTQCDEVRLPGVAGGFGIRPGHTPLVAALAPGELVHCTVVASDGYDLIARPTAELDKKVGLKVLR